MPSGPPWRTQPERAARTAPIDLVSTLADTVSVHAAMAQGNQAQGGGHAGHHSIGPYSLAAAIFPYLALGYIWTKRAILRRRYRAQEEAMAREDA